MRFPSAKEMLQFLDKGFGIPDPQEMAQQELEKLSQGARSFSDLYGQFT